MGVEGGSGGETKALHTSSDPVPHLDPGAQTQHYSGRELKGFEMRACMLVIHAPSLPPDAAIAQPSNNQP